MEAASPLIFSLLFTSHYSFATARCVQLLRPHALFWDASFKSLTGNTTNSQLMLTSLYLVSSSSKPQTNRSNELLGISTSSLQTHQTEHIQTDLISSTRTLTLSLAYTSFFPSLIFCFSLPGPLMSPIHLPGKYVCNLFKFLHGNLS